MVMMQGRVSAEFDAAAHTLLAGTGSPVGAVTDAGADRDVNTAVGIDTLTPATAKPNTGHAYWDNNEVPLGIFIVNIWISAISGVASTFDFALEAYTTSDFSSARRVVAELKLKTTDGPGFYRFAVDSKTMQLMAAGDGAANKFVALSTTKATASPSVTYTAWLGYLCA